MKDVSDLSVTQYYLFGAGRVPYTHLSTRQALEALQEAFAFRDVGAFPGTELGFEAGVAVHPTAGKVTIRRLQISNRRIILDVAGESATAAEVFEMLRKQIVQHDPTDRFAAARPVVLREDTACTAVLEVPWDRFFNPALVRYLDERFAAAASDDDASVMLNTLKLRFTYTYQVKSATIAQHGIALAPKNLIVEPLVDTPLEDHRYFTTSPTDSATHLRLLRDLEQALA